MIKRYYLWVMVALMVVVSVLPGCIGEKQVTSSNTPHVQDVTSQEAFNQIQENKNNPDFIILDVRTASEFYDGHIEGALNIDVNLPSFGEEMGKFYKNILYHRMDHCRIAGKPVKKLSLGQSPIFADHLQT